MAYITDQLRDRNLADGNMEINDFFDTLKALIDASWGEGWGVFSDDEPTGNDAESLLLPMITYDVGRRTPSVAMKTPKPRLHHTGADPNNPGESIVIYRQYFDYNIRFDIWAKTNQECSKLMRRFEDLVFTFTGYLKSCGVHEILFESEGVDKTSNKSRQDIIFKSVRYYVRIERVTVIRKKNLKEVIERVYVKQGSSVPEWVQTGDIPLPLSPSAFETRMQTMD